MKVFKHVNTQTRTNQPQRQTEVRSYTKSETRVLVHGEWPIAHIWLKQKISVSHNQAHPKVDVFYWYQCSLPSLFHIYFREKWGNFIVLVLINAATTP